LQIPDVGRYAFLLRNLSLTLLLHQGVDLQNVPLLAGPQEDQHSGVPTPWFNAEHLTEKGRERLSMAANSTPQPPSLERELPFTVKKEVVEKPSLFRRMVKKVQDRPKKKDWFENF
jgi:hypothetical protein